jgi:hypothetical protein
MVTIYNKGKRTIQVKGFEITPGKQHVITEEAATLIKKMYPSEFEFLICPNCSIAKVEVKKNHKG